jgi:hypothetical protein
METPGQRIHGGWTPASTSSSWRHRAAIGIQTAMVTGPDGTPAGDVIVAFAAATWLAT